MASTSTSVAPPAPVYMASTVPSAQVVNAQVNSPPKEWDTSILACLTECESCLIGTLCPCVLYGKNKTMLNGEDCCFPCCIFSVLLMPPCFLCLCCYTSTSRKDIRNALNLKPTPCYDCPTHCCLLSCALCQEHRQMKKAGGSPASPIMSIYHPARASATGPTSHIVSQPIYVQQSHQVQGSYAQAQVPTSYPEISKGTTAGASTSGQPITMV